MRATGDDTDRTLERLGTARVTAFLRAIRGADGHPVSAELVNRELDEGRSLPSIFDPCRTEGFFLSVQGRGRRFRIEFGYTLSLVGDGGTWEVEFDRDGAVVSAEQTTIWIS